MKAGSGKGGGESQERRAIEKRLSQRVGKPDVPIGGKGWYGGVRCSRRKRYDSISAPYLARRPLSRLHALFPIDGVA